MKITPYVTVADHNRVVNLHVLSLDDNHCLRIDMYDIESHLSFETLRGNFPSCGLRWLNGIHLCDECVEPDILLQLVMSTVLLEVFQHLTVVDEALVSDLEWKVWEGHHLLREICLEVPVHWRVDRQPVLVHTQSVGVDPGAPNGARLLEDGDLQLGTGGHQVSGSTQSCSPRPWQQTVSALACQHSQL